MPATTEQNPHRLPTTVAPRRYELTLEPDLDAARFTGRVAIEVDVVEPTDTVVLNGAELVITDAEIERDGRQATTSITLDDVAERVTLHVDAPLPVGRATVRLRFAGVLNDMLRGFYRSTFTDQAGDERVLAASQMEATDARRAFPCWDEPDAKAVFSVTLVVPPEVLAVSNAAEVGREPAHDGKVAVRFADTIPLSTYLIAFVVGPLVATDPIDVDGTPLRVICPPGKQHLADFALEVGAFALRWFSDWFAVPYPGDKLDLVAIPDFAFGAMENLGCITFRERYVLVDPATSTQAERQAVVDVIAHEVAHMWFGDLVTMRWWNGIWLNEAFATFMEMACTDAFRPDWHRWVDFGLSRSAAFDTDALEATRPIEYPVVSPADAEGMFDVLTYEKGASVVRMLEQYLGADRFRAGIRRYIAEHRFGNTETSDLWDALEAETGEPVRRIAESWIFQGGFPEVAVQTAGDDERGSPGSGGSVTLSQRRFRYDGVNDGERWSVPLVVEHGSADGGAPVRERVLLDERRHIAVSPGGWVAANAGAHGFYRVRYAPALLDALVARRADLSPLERYVLVDDVWAGALAGSATAADFVELAERFGDEDDLSVWERLVGGLAQLDRLVDGDARQQLQTRVATLVGPVRARLGPTPRAGDDDRTLTLRALLLQTAALLGGDGAAVDHAANLLDQFLTEPKKVDPNLASAALTVTATLGDAELHDRLVDHLQTTTNPQDRERLQSSLARFRDAHCLARTLDLVLSAEVRTQDAPLLMRDALTNRDNAELAWRFTVDRWEQMQARFPSNSLPRLLSGIRAFRDRSLADDAAAFVAQHPLVVGGLQLRQHVERMWVAVRFAEREAERFPAALALR